MSERKQRGKAIDPVCTATECFGCQDGHCVVLTDTRFKGTCPFFKTKKQVEEERAICQERLAQLRKGEENEEED